MKHDTLSVNHTYFKFSPLNSLSRNLENCSRPTGSIRSSRKLKPHRFTRFRDTSLLWFKKHNYFIVEDAQDCALLILTQFDRYPTFRYCPLPKGLADLEG